MSRRATHVVDGPERGSGGEALVDELDRQSRPPVQILGEAPHVGRALGILSILIERQSNHKAPSLQRGRATNDLRDRYALPGAALDEASR